MKKFIALFLSLVLAFGAPTPAFAAYANLIPPPGWAQGLGAASATVGNTFKFASAATETTLLLGRIGAQAALTVAGQTVAVPVSMRLGAGAAVAALEWSFGNPYLFAAALAAPVAYNWYKDSGLSVENGIWVKADSPCTSSGCTIIYSLPGYPLKSRSASAVCSQLSSQYPNSQYSNFSFSYAGDRVACAVTEDYHPPQAVPKSTVIGYFALNTETGPAEFPAKVPVPLPQFKEIMLPKPLPDAALRELNEVKYPVEDPFISADPGVLSVPNSSPQSRPFWVPTGNPVKNPSVAGQPDTWTQPGNRVTPSPVTGNPWQVDVVSEPKTKTNPTPNTEETVTAPVPPKPAEEVKLETCGLPGKPKCLIDETGTPLDKAASYDTAKTDVDKVVTDTSVQINTAQDISVPAWTFSFQFPTGCAPYSTGLRGFIMNICPYQSTIHDLLSMVWAAATAFCIIGMVGRTIRES